MLSIGRRCLPTHTAFLDKWNFQTSVPCLICLFFSDIAPGFSRREFLVILVWMKNFAIHQTVLATAASPCVESLGYIGFVQGSNFLSWSTYKIPSPSAQCEGNSLSILHWWHKLLVKISSQKLWLLQNEAIQKNSKRLGRLKSKLQVFSKPRKGTRDYGQNEDTSVTWYMTTFISYDS